MRMSVQVPRSMMGAIPDAHGVVTDHDGLAMYGDFRKVEPKRTPRSACEFVFRDFPGTAKIFIAANLLAVLQRFRRAPRCRNPLGNREECHWP